MWILWLVVLLGVLNVSLADVESQTKDSSTYKAGVVEYNPITGLPDDSLEKNLQSYLDIIKTAKAEQVDILVFPEATLNRGLTMNPNKTSIRVPDPIDKIIPCNSTYQNNSRILELLSCAAKNDKIYVVVNVAEAVDCLDTPKENCTDNEIVLFNTNVVFDRNGTVISRYRKINLWGETGFTGSFDENLGVFETDFGVKFGHFICFDILFQRPAVATVETEKLQNIIFPTMWFSELPSLTGVEFQEAWAYTHNVNFLAAGANNPIVGSTGSGIYSGKNGALVAVMYGNSTTQLLVADVPKDPNVSNIGRNKISNKPEAMDSLFLKKNNMTLYNSELINESVENSNFTISHSNASCQFIIKINKNITSTNPGGKNHYRYRAIIYEGIRSFEFKNAGIFECGIIACISEELDSCGKRFEKYSEINPTFEISSVEIVATVYKPMFNDTLKSMDTAYYPVTLRTDIMPLDLTEFSYKENANNLDSTKINLNMKSDRAHTDLLMFGIFGRTYHLDHLPLPGAASNIKFVNFYAIVSFCLFSLFIFDAANYHRC